MDAFVAWLRQQRDSLISLAKCSIGIGFLKASVWSDLQWRAKLACSEDWVLLTSLPCPQLRELHLSTLKVQLEPSDGCQGVLHDCKSFTALHLEACIAADMHTAAAAIAALPELCSLTFLTEAHPRTDPSVHNPVGGHVQTEKQFQPGDLQACTKLRKLCLHLAHGVRQEQVTQLSALRSLEHLELPRLAYSDALCTLTSELPKLTCICLGDREGGVLAGQLEQLSSLTALRDLSLAVISRFGEADHMLGLCFQQLPQLTSIQLRPDQGVYDPPADYVLEVSNSINSCSTLTMLQRVSLAYCWVQPAALGMLTQLRSLALLGPQSQDPLPIPPPYEELLVAVSKLPLLTELCLANTGQWHVWYSITPPWRPTGACVALLASSNLRSLQIGLRVDTEDACEGCMLFPEQSLSRACRVYPHLRQIDLVYGCESHPMPISARQLQYMCSCCPFVESLGFALCQKPSAPFGAYLPLLQLSALTALDIWSADAAVVGAVSKLSKLKQLTLHRFPTPTSLTLLQLTALAALEDLTLYSSLPWLHPLRKLQLLSKLRWFTERPQSAQSVLSSHPGTCHIVGVTPYAICSHGARHCMACMHACICNIVAKHPAGGTGK
jgi:hypothetical protein